MTEVSEQFCNSVHLDHVDQWVRRAAAEDAHFNVVKLIVTRMIDVPRILICFNPVEAVVAPSANPIDVIFIPATVAVVPAPAECHFAAERKQRMSPWWPCEPRLPAWVHRSACVTHTCVTITARLQLGRVEKHIITTMSARKVALTSHVDGSDRLWLAVCIYGELRSVAVILFVLDGRRRR